MADVTATARRDGTVAALVRELAAMLASAGIEDAGREARDMVAAVNDAPRFWAALHEHEVVSAECAERCRRAARHRSTGAPFAYAVERTAFRHLTLHVDERVLIPRQETELLVDEVLTRESTGLAIDIGTGSGAIALALATEGKFDRVIGTDVSSGAIAVARANGERLAAALTTALEWREGALLAPVAGERARVFPSRYATGSRRSRCIVRRAECPSARVSFVGHQMCWSQEDSW